MTSLCNYVELAAVVRRPAVASRAGHLRSEDDRGAACTAALQAQVGHPVKGTVTSSTAGYTRKTKELSRFLRKMARDGEMLLVTTLHAHGLKPPVVLRRRTHVKRALAKAKKAPADHRRQHEPTAPAGSPASRKDMSRHERRGRNRERRARHWRD